MKDNQTAGTYTAKEIFAVFCIVIFAGIIRIPSLTQPIGPDQGIMAVIGEGLLHGKLPYRDFWEMASPAIFFTYAVMFKLFSVSMATIPITDTIVSMFTTFIIFFFARSLWGRNAGYVSALFFAVFSNGVRLGMHSAGDIAFGTFWYIAQRETFMLPLITASFYFAIYSVTYEKKDYCLILSGFLAGLSFVYKFPSLIMFACVMFYLNWSILSRKNGKLKKTLLKKNIVLISGLMLAIIPFVLFFSFKGVRNEMIDIIFKYVYSVYGQTSHDFLTTANLGISRTFFLGKENFILWIFFIASSLYIGFNERVRENVLVVLWALASIMYIISHREFFGYHYLMVLPPFSLLSGYGIARAMGTGLKWRQIFTAELNKIVIIFAVIANLFVYATFVHMNYTKFYFYITGKITKEEYYGFFNAYPKHDYSFPADYAVAKYIKTNTNSNDLIFTLGGIESTIHFLTQKRCPSRFVYSWIIFSDSHGKVKQAEAYREEALLDLKAKIPKYIITVRSIESFKQFAAIYQFITDNYVLDKVFPDDRYVYVHRKFVRI